MDCFNEKLKYFIIILIITSIPLKAQHKTTVTIINSDNCGLNNNIQDHVTRLISLLNECYSQNKTPDIPKDYFTESGRQNLVRLWNSASFFCPETELKLEPIKTNSGFELRGISLKCKGQEGEISSEELELVVSKSGIIEDVYFGIENNKYKSLLNKGTSVTDFRRRQIILDFVENFRTAYNRKDINYLENVFSDDALIIVGRVVEKKPDDSNFLERNFSKEKVVLLKSNKVNYISNLKSVFERNSFIKVDFEKLEITNSRKHPDIYGVNLIQAWTSTAYSDKGFLFLMIDFKDETHPLIHVRAWQPTEFTKEEDSISLGNFDIID